ncbi:MAG: 23S rRNA (guanosine(2251)-2'-O)-methyltransferase RlmB [Eubacteriaceae bacterium]|nr:23S rRNA (guanosine(2251)-2'-O)-methyltransferase RlmB [Eubacteriaceae bacterium]
MQNTKENNNIIAGRNAVMEAVKSGRDIDRIVVAKGTEGSVNKIVGRAKEMKIPIRYADRSVLDKTAEGTAHQGIIAFAAAHAYCEIEEILGSAREKGEDPFVIILDNLEDPHNLGAIMRSGECAGAHGVIIGKRRSVGLTETVAKASAGAIEYMPCARVANIGQAIDKLKEKGLWIAACDMGDDVFYKADLTGPIGIVIGSEGSGIGRLVREKCDFTVSIPMKGRIDSLNASNAAAILMYEIRRQRDGKKL